MPNLTPNRTERTHLRHANSKHFLLDNGQSQVEIYLQPIHYLDDAGVWQDIESTLKASGDHVRCVNRRAPVRLSRYADGSVTIDDRHGRSISYRPVGPAHVKGSHAKHVLTHVDAWPDTDLQWITSTSGLVKLLTLKSAESPDSYLFTVATEGLTLTQDADGIIRARSGEEVVFILTRPWCHDAAGVDGPVSYSLEDGAIRVSVDPAWLGEESRAWPVEVDPTEIQPDAAAGKDAYVSSAAADTNYGTATTMNAGNTGGTQKRRSLVEFVVTTYAGKTLLSANLGLYCSAESSVTDYVVGAHEITAAWDELTVTWNNQPANDAVAEATVSITGTAAWFTWDLTTLVQAWLDGASTNNGVKLVNASEATENSAKTFYSSDYSVTDLTKCPKLVLIFLPLVNPTSPLGTVGAPGTVTDDVSPQLAWTYTAGDGPAQSQYQVQLYTSAGDLVVDSGAVASANAYYNCAANLLDYDITYKWRANVYDGTYWSGYSSWNYFTTDLSAPITVVATADAAAAEIDIAWAAHAGEDLYGYIVYRKLHDAADSTYIRVNYTSVTTNAFADDTAQTGLAYAYAVSAVANDGFESDKSTHGDGTVTFTGYWLGEAAVKVRPTPRWVRPRLASARVALNSAAVNQDYGYGPRQLVVEFRYDTIAGREALFDAWPTGEAKSYRDEKGYVIRGTLIGDVSEDILEIPGATTMGWLTFTIAEVTA